MQFGVTDIHVTICMVWVHTALVVIIEIICILLYFTDKISLRHTIPGIKFVSVAYILLCIVHIGLQNCTLGVQSLLSSLNSDSRVPTNFQIPGFFKAIPGDCHQIQGKYCMKY